jgi:hypothetical protein
MIYLYGAKNVLSNVTYTYVMDVRTPCEKKCKIKIKMFQPVHISKSESCIHSLIIFLVIFLKLTYFGFTS